MRLTLRTLLAYLDDTLEPARSREIGQKLAETPAAQELVDRIHRVTRKRGLGVPPDGTKGDAGDPNTVAQYLNDSLSSEQVADFERECLESDATLAEVAACHQILALVLSEQVSVPPTARRRMYGLVGPPASLPNRKPGKAIPVGGSRDDAPPPDDRIDASYLLGMSAMSAGERPAVKLARLGVIGLVAAALVAAVAVAWPGRSESPRESAAVTVPATPPATPPAAAEKPPVEPPPVTDATLPLPKTLEVVPPAKAGEALMPKTDGGGGEPPVKSPADGVKPAEEPKPEGEPKADPAAPPAPAAPPPAPARTDRAVTGQWEKREPAAVLVRKSPLDGSWVRVPPAEPEVVSGDRLVCLPGYKAAVKLSSGVAVELWGNLPDLFVGSPVLEAAVTPALPPPGFAADLTVHAGRVYVSNRSKVPGGSAVRVRVGGAVWDVRLADEKAEVAVEVSRQLAPGTAEGVRAAAGLHVVSGAARVTPAGGEAADLARGEELYWDSATGKTRRGAAAGDARGRADRSAYWSKFPVYPDAARAKAALAALDDFARRIGDPSRVRATIDETLQARDPGSATLQSLSAARVAVFLFAALGDLNGLADCLSDPTRPYIREAAIVGLRSLFASDPEAAGDFRELLVDKVRLPEDQADAVLRLLSGLKPAERADPETPAMLGQLLDSPALPVRELAFATLLGYVDPSDGGVKALLTYDAGASADQRAAATAAWRKKIAEVQKKIADAAKTPKPEDAPKP